MSSEPITAKHATSIEDRRRHLRRKVDDLAYVACGPDNGGILLDVSEGGLSFQGVGTLTDGKILEVRFVLPGLTSAIETSGQLVWSTDSKRGGLRFVNLDGSARQQTKQWVSGGAASADRKAQTSPDPHASGAPVSNTDAEPVRAGGLFATSATPASESILQPSPNLPVPSGGPSGQATIPPQAPRTMFADGMRRIHSVVAVPPDAQPVMSPTESPVAAELTQRIVLSGVPERSSRAVLYLLGATLGCVIIIAAGVIGFRAQRGSGAATASKGAALAPEQSVGDANRNFQVEVVDIRNRRLVLSDDAATTSLAFDQAGARKGLRNSPPESGTKASVPSFQAGAVAPPNRSLQDLTLQSPRRLNRPAGLAEPQAPAVVASLAPPVASFDSTFLAAESPNQPRPPQPPAELVRPRSGLQEAVLIKRVEPTYSAVARQARAAGTVQVNATIGTDGVPRALRFVSGDARLAAPALDAIRLWRYKPALLDGQAIETEVVVQVKFQLKQ